MTPYARSFCGARLVKLAGCGLDDSGGRGGTGLGVVATGRARDRDAATCRTRALAMQRVPWSLINHLDLALALDSIRSTRRS